MLGNITNILKKVFGDKSERDLKELMPIVDATNEAYAKLQNLSNDELRTRTTALKQRIAEHLREDEDQVAELEKHAEKPETSFEEKDNIYKEVDALKKGMDGKLEDILLEIAPEAFAVIKETAHRFKENEAIEVRATAFDRELAATRSGISIEGEMAIWETKWLAGGSEVNWDMLHYDVQIIGGMTLHQGKVAEMQTGEGKTLVATMPIYLNALAGKGVHIVTVNDYLAKRDSEWMGPIMEWHGLSVDCIDKHQPNSSERRAAYKKDIIYGTNNEFGFDYLRDNMATNPGQLVQQKHHYAIVDEVDSVLIDDARTPLIISGPTPRGDQHEYSELKPKVEKLFGAQRKLVTTLLTDAKKYLKGIDDGSVDKESLTAGGLALLRAHRGLPRNKALIKFLSEPGIRQHLQKTENHYLQDQAKEMPTVDAELYFVIDEKNNSIELGEKGVDLISGSAAEADFYIMPDIGGKIVEIDNSNETDEEKLAAKEALSREFGAKSERIHSMNQLLKAYTLFEKDVEYVVIEGKVKIVDEQTGRIMEGRRYSDGLHQAIEAKEQVKIEAATQTYATITLQNYFRMYHKLAGMTGTAETEAKELWDIYELDVVMVPTNRPVIRKDEQDKVYKTTREKYNAVIDEIVALRDAGRPVLVGTTSVEVSELLSRILKQKGVEHNVLNAKMHQRESEIVASAGVAGAVTIATNMAGRGTDIKLGEGVKAAGGLAIIGTERHDSRRVDRQLRGRAGRQGDSGSSQFFVSLEDNLMRLFGSERIAKMMDRLGLKEGEVIQHSMITKSIERAQKKVEENNFGIRKHLLEYDDVMNMQREVIYKKRRHALHGERLEVDIANMFQDICNNVAEDSKEFGNYTDFRLEVLKNLSMQPPLSEEEYKKSTPSEIGDALYHALLKSYKRKNEAIAEKAWPVLKSVVENEGNKYETISIPFSDGRRQMNITADLKKAYESEGKALTHDLEKGISMSLIDQAWKEHLREMDDLRTNVRQAQYEQKDPLLIYKFESFKLFREMIEKISQDTISFLFRAEIPVNQDGNTPQPDQRQLERTRRQREEEQKRIQTNRNPVNDSATTGGRVATAPPPQRQQKVQPIRIGKKVGRNDPCPCGSGKKYKQCHGK